MKKPIVFLGVIAFLATSCGETDSGKENQEENVSAETNTDENTEDIVSEVKETSSESEDQIVSKYNYDADWVFIKEAMMTGDEYEISMWTNPNDVDPSLVAVLAQEEYVLNALEESTYESLDTQEMDGEMYLVFYAEELGQDEEGNEVGSSVTIYLRQGDPNLEIAYIFAAG